MRLRSVVCAASSVLLFSSSALAQKAHLLQKPALTRTTIVFNYAGDLWSVDRNGGKASRLTVGVGLETAPVVSPDGRTVAFSGEYDGNTDVFTIPIEGGVPERVTYHPSADVPVAWTPDGGQIIFRSDRQSYSRYTQLYQVPAGGGVARLMPLPLAYQGALSADGKSIAYSPLAPAFGFNYNSYVSWGNYRGGRAGTVNITNLATLETAAIPHDKSSDFSPVWLGKKVYFLSDRKGSVGVFCYDPASKAVTEVLANAGPDIHSLSAGPDGLVYDKLGEIYTLTPDGKTKLVAIDVDADLPEVRDHIQTVSTEIVNADLSPTGLRAVFEAHGEILTVPARKGPTRDLTNTPGVMERSPVWSPDGQSIAYFSDESGLYALHVASQTGSGVKKFALAPEPAYYFSPKWSPDSKLVAFYDNRLNLWMVDTATGKLSHVGDKNQFSQIEREMAWTPDSKWLAYTHDASNHLHVLELYNVATGQSTKLTDQMADSRAPAFDRNGKYLYFTASTNQAGTAFGLDMTSDLLRVSRGLYALVLAADSPSPLAPESDDEKTLAAARERSKDMGDEPSAEAAAKADEAKPEADKKPGMPVPPNSKPTRVDLAGIGDRIVPLPLPPGSYSDLQTGKPGGFFYLERSGEGRGEGGGGATVKHFSLESRKADTIAERVESYTVSANGEKMLIAQMRNGSAADAPPAGGRGAATWSIVSAVSAAAPSSPAARPSSESSALNLADMQVRVVPQAEWQQIYHEVWRIERAYFYDPGFHGVNTVAEEKRFEPFVQSIASRTDLNYILQEMLQGFSVGHLRGNGGNIPEAKRVAGGLLGADYVVTNNRYCIAKLYAGGHWNPTLLGPLTQPGLNVHVGDCIVAVGGQDITASDDLQRPLEGTAGHAVNLRIQPAGGGPARDITVIPIRSEAALRNQDWIDGNQKRVDELSGGKLAYVYLPDTGEGGFTNFNRYYFAQDDKQGAVIDERFNGGGQVADYIIEAMQRRLMDYWSPRYGQIDRTPNAAILGAKVMITNEFSGSGGDAMPYLFRQQKIGPLVGKRTWGGLVGIGSIPPLMDGGSVTSPSFGQFSLAGEWDVENRGVEPDFAIDQDPKAVAEGHDPQLEKAVSLALDDLTKHPVPVPSRPPYPNYHKQ